MASPPTFKQQCPTCDAMVSVKESMIGKKVECTKCKDKFIAEMPEEDEEIDIEVEEDAPAKKDTKVGSKKNTTAKAGAGSKRGKLAVEEEEEEDDEVEEEEDEEGEIDDEEVDEEDEKPQTKSTKSKAATNGKLKKGDDEDEEESNEAEGKTPGGSKKLLIGLGLAGVGVLILVIAGWFLMAPPRVRPVVTPITPGQGDSKGGDDNKAPVTPITPSKDPAPASVPLDDAELARLSNLLPNDSEHVFRVAFRDLFATGSTLRAAVFEAPGALDDADLRKKLGFSVLSIDDLIVVQKNTDPGWKFTVIHFKDVVNETELKAALKLESAGAVIEGQAYYKLTKANPALDMLARVSFGIPNFYRYFEAQGGDRPSYLRLHTPQTLIIGDKAPVTAFLKVKGQFPMQTIRTPPATSDPKTPTPTPGGMSGGSPMPPVTPTPGGKTGGSETLPDPGKKGARLKQPGDKPEFISFVEQEGVPVEEVQAALTKLRESLGGTTWDGMEDGTSKLRLVFDNDKSLNLTIESTKVSDPKTKAEWAIVPERPLNKIRISTKVGLTYDLVVDAASMTGMGSMGGKIWPITLQKSAGDPNPNPKDPNPKDPNPKDPTPPPNSGRDDTYLTINPSLKMMLDKMESRLADKDAVLFSSATNMDASTLDPKDTGIKDAVIRLPRQFWDVTLMLNERKPRIRFLGTAMHRRDTLKYQLRNEFVCAQDIDATEYKQELMDRTSYQISKFFFTLAKHDVKLPKAVVKVVVPDPPPGTEPKIEEKKVPEALVSQMTVNQDGNRVEFVLDLLLDNNTLTQARDITMLAVGTLRVEIEAAATASLRHHLALAGKWSGEKGLSQRQIPPGTFPPGAFLRPNARLYTEKEPKNRISWMAGLLPYMGHQSLYDKINFNQSWRDSSNWLAGHTSVPQFLDPMYPDFSRQTSIGDMPLDFATTHFVGIAGVGLDAAHYPKGHPNRGIFGYDGSATVQEVQEKRGLGNTILMIQIPYDQGTGVSPWIAGGGATVRGVPEKNSIAPFILGKDRNDKVMQYEPKKGAGMKGTYALMSDGSVRFISENVSDDVFKAMCTLGGNQPADFDLKTNPHTLLVPAPTGLDTTPKKVLEKPPLPKIDVEKKPPVVDPIKPTAGDRLSVPGKFTVDAPAGFSWKKDKDVDFGGPKGAIYVCESASNPAKIHLIFIDGSPFSEADKQVFLQTQFTKAEEALKLGGFKIAASSKPNVGPPVPNRVTYSFEGTNPLGKAAALVAETVFSKNIYVFSVATGSRGDSEQLLKITQSLKE